MVKVAQALTDGSSWATSVAMARRFRKSDHLKILAVVICTLPLSLSIRDAQAIELTAGDVQLSGEIIRSTGSTVTFKLDVGRIINVAPKDISVVRIQMKDGTLAEGPLLQWQDGMYVIGVDDRKVYVQNGQVVRVEDKAPAGNLALETPAEDLVPAENLEVDDPVADAVGAGGPQTEGPEDQAVQTTPSSPAVGRPVPVGSQPENRRIRDLSRVPM